MEFGKTVWVKVNSLKRLLDAHKKKTACSRPRFGGAAHLFELNEDKTQPIVLTRLCGFLFVVSLYHSTKIFQL